MATQDIRLGYQHVEEVVPSASRVSLYLSSKISEDNPEWLKSTFHHYHRSELKPP